MLCDDPDATPAYVVRLGRVDVRGIEAGTRDAERSIRYVTKYLTKDLVEHAGPEVRSAEGALRPAPPGTVGPAVLADVR